MSTYTFIMELSDDALITRTRTLVQNKRSTTAELVAHLAEMDTRRLHLAEGCSSLFVYCMQVLHLSEFAAYTRIAAARAGRRFPLVFERLASGEVHLSAVDLLSPHLTEENHHELLDRARYRSKRDVEKLVAEVAPRPPVASRIRRVPVQSVPVAPETETSTPQMQDRKGHSAPELPLIEHAPDPGPQAVMKNSRPARVEPLSPEHYKIQFTADPETVELLRKAQDLLRHQILNGDPAVIFAMALKDLVQKLEKKKAAEVARPRAAKPDATGEPPAQNTRYIPASVRREVWRRDQARCAFIGRDGRRCAETGHLEFHHSKPFARGGRATAVNLVLRCRAHNGYEAVKEFGERSVLFAREREAVYWSRDQLGWPPLRVIQSVHFGDRSSHPIQAIGEGLQEQGELHDKMGIIRPAGVPGRSSLCELHGIGTSCPALPGGP